MKKSAILISVLFFVGLATAYAEDGSRLFHRKGCYTCHGQAGTQPIGPNYPVLAGQNAGYIFNQIKSFHQGHRSVSTRNATIKDQRRLNNPNQMVSFANSLNKEGDEVIKSVAKYLSGQHSTKSYDTDSSLVAKGKVLFTDRGCNACHGEAGKAPIMDQYPKLAGQGPVYIQHQLTAFRHGTRSGTDTTALMAPMAATLTVAESEAVANYLGSLQR